jgi:hypothetical protein
MKLHGLCTALLENVSTTSVRFWKHVISDRTVRRNEVTHIFLGIAFTARIGCHIRL